MQLQLTWFPDLLGLYDEGKWEAFQNNLDSNFNALLSEKKYAESLNVQEDSIIELTQ